MEIPLTEGWKFKQSSTLNSIAQDWLPVSQFPTVAHIDLLYHKLIPDPYIDKNELEALWVNDADWTYRTTEFPNIAEHSDIMEIGGDRRAVLVFEGLDTVCDVYFLGEKVLEARNMHRSYRVDVTDVLGKWAEGGKGKEEKMLELRFRAAPKYGQDELKRIGYKGNGKDVHFGGGERLFVRKAQYHWGWESVLLLYLTFLPTAPC